ncbi:predicted protein [Plenodomus lingam JN3]|uniref:Uncharacterized protein n=1 Tax=Leptosphaeria maculans (strain JN3 / isolate v23.1.3 / race Av1-4-5-6-7-8) TaxID=985895 RepID=M1ZIL9_LEPMJ|nr:predicted protein [Plenodomus lingam JN3]
MLAKDLSGSLYAISGQEASSQFQGTISILKGELSGYFDNEKVYATKLDQHQEKERWLGDGTVTTLNAGKPRPSSHNTYYVYHTIDATTHDPARPLTEKRRQKGAKKKVVRKINRGHPRIRLAASSLQTHTVQKSNSTYLLLRIYHGSSLQSITFQEAARTAATPSRDNTYTDTTKGPDKYRR